MKNNLKENWIPKWQENWNNRNLHKIKGEMVIKERHSPETPPDLPNHDRMLIRESYREVAAEQRAKNKVTQ